MLKSFIKKNVGFIIGTILFISLAVSSGTYLFGTNGVEYTESYAIYNEVKDFTKTKELEKYLQDKNINYNIDDNCLKLSEHKIVKFDINDDNTCTIIKTGRILCFERLTFDYDKDVNQTIYHDEDGNLVKEASIDAYGYFGTRINNNYYAQCSIFAAVFILCTLFGAAGVIIVISSYVDYKKKY